MLYVVEGDGALMTARGPVEFSAGSLALYRPDEELRVTNAPHPPGLPGTSVPASSLRSPHHHITGKGSTRVPPHETTSAGTLLSSTRCSAVRVSRGPVYAGR